MVPLHPPSCCCRLSCLPLPSLRSRRWKSLERTRLPELMGWVWKLFCSIVIYHTSPRCRGSSAQDGGVQAPREGERPDGGFQIRVSVAQGSIWGLTKFCGRLEHCVKVGFANSFCVAAVFLSRFMKCNGLKRLCKITSGEP